MRQRNFAARPFLFGLFHALRAPVQQFRTQPDEFGPDGCITCDFLATHAILAVDGKWGRLGSPYAWAWVDAGQNALHSARNCGLHLPPDIPAKDVGSLLIYSSRARSMIRTDQQFPSASMRTRGLAVDAIPQWQCRTAILTMRCLDA